MVEGEDAGGITEIAREIASAIHRRLGAIA
jgi:hypothetical protein